MRQAAKSDLPFSANLMRASIATFSEIPDAPKTGLIEVPHKTKWIVSAEFPNSADTLSPSPAASAKTDTACLTSPRETPMRTRQGRWIFQPKNGEGGSTKLTKRHEKRNSRPSFPNSVWERTLEGNSVSQAGVSARWPHAHRLRTRRHPLHAKQSFARNGVPKQEFGNEVRV